MHQFPLMVGYVLYVFAASAGKITDNRAHSYGSPAGKCVCLF